MSAGGSSKALEALSMRAKRPVVMYVTTCARVLSAASPGTAHHSALIDRLSRDLDLVHAAFRFLILDGYATEAASLVTNLTSFWQLTNRHLEALALLRHIDLTERPLEPETRARIDESTAALFRDLGNVDSAREAADRALGLYIETGDRQGVTRCRLLLSACLGDQGHWEEARLQLALLHGRNENVGDRVALARSLHQEGWSDLEAGLLLSAEQKFSQAAAIWEELGDREQHTRCLISLGGLAVRLGAIEDARRRFGHAAVQAREHAYLGMLAEVLADQASTAALDRDLDSALTHLAECFEIYRQIDPRSRLAEAMEAGGAVALRCRRYVVAGRFFGAAQQLRLESGIQPFAPWSGRIGDWIEELEEASSARVPASIDTAATDLIELAIEWMAALRTPGNEGSGVLTERERAVLRMLVLGLTDHQIASELFISRRTVSKHVSSLLRKLDQPTRTAAAAKALQEGMV